VRVLSVATQNRPGKVRRFKYGYVHTPTTKRAVVKVHADDRIELF
jgi:ribosomal protein L23